MKNAISVVLFATNPMRIQFNSKNRIELRFFMLLDNMGPNSTTVFFYFSRTSQQVTNLNWKILSSQLIRAEAEINT